MKVWSIMKYSVSRMSDQLSIMIPKGQYRSALRRCMIFWMHVQNYLDVSSHNLREMEADLEMYCINLHGKIYFIDKMDLSSHVP